MLNLVSVFKNSNSGETKGDTDRDREEMMMSVFKFGNKEKTQRGTLYASTYLAVFKVCPDPLLVSYGTNHSLTPIKTHFIPCVSVKEVIF
jgi:hypothetical protein